jgi:hypothetical protein
MADFKAERMKKFFLNNLGSTLVNVMIAGAAVAAGGVYMMSTMKDQKSISKKANTKAIYSVIRKEIAESLSDGNTCLKTLEWGATNNVTGNFDVPAVKDGTGQALYDSSTTLYNHKISKMKFEVEDYVAKSGYHFQDSNFTFLVEPLDPKYPGQNIGTGQTLKMSIPLFTMMTDSKISSCLSNDAGSVSDAYKAACEVLGGAYQEGEGTCLGLHGQDSYLYDYLQSYFCSSNPGNCNKIPMAGKTCLNANVGEEYGNAVIAGFDATGNPRCQCLALKSCPNATDKALYCKGTDLGTDGCGNQCGSGTKTDGACAPCTDTTWKPLANNVCAGQAFVQVSNCGNTKNAVGTEAEVYKPLVTQVCNGQKYTATSNCGNTKQQTGTKACSCSVPATLSWSETISGTKYNCSASSTTSTLQDGQSVVGVAKTGTNTGSAEFVCSQGSLYATKQICSSLPKKMDCHIYYKLSFDRAPGSSQDGGWIVIRNDATENCGSSGCYMTVGVACPNSDAEVRVSYALKINGQYSGTVWTPWSGMDGTIQWGPSVMRGTQDNDECSSSSYGSGCGIKMTVETRGGGSCTIDYGWGIENIRKNASNGSEASFYCTNNYGSPPCEEHGCNEGYGCGMTAKLNCSI